MTDVIDRTPPHDLVAERSALGGMLLSPDAVDAVSELVSGRDFYEPRHTLVFDAVMKLVKAGTPADPVTVADALDARGELARIGGAVYLHTLVESVPTAANAGYYARIVGERAQLRRLIETGTRIVQLGYGAVAGSGQDIAGAVDRAQAELHAATVTRESTGVTWSALADGLLDRITTRRDDLVGLSTGYLDLDRLTGGYRPGQLIIVAGRPGMGKSVFAVDAARTCVFRDGGNAVVFSLEMDRDELADRIISAESNVLLKNIRERTVSDNDLVKVSKALGRLDDAGGKALHIDDDAAALTLAAIRSRARRIQQRHGLDLVVVDYVQLIPTAGLSAESRQLQVAEISRGLKLLAKELRVPVIALAQLNRGPEQRQDKRPGKADLRESGALENDADIVILLHRPEVYDKNSPQAGTCEFIVDKNRHGPPATITVAAQLHRSRFADMAIPPTASAADPFSADQLGKGKP